MKTPYVRRWNSADVYKERHEFRAILTTVNVVIFAGGNFRENVDKTFHVGVIFTILLLFSS